MSEEKVKCPACGERIELDEDFEAGDAIYCPGCYVDLKIIKRNPLRVEEVKEEELDDYDWDDEGDNN